MAVAPPIPVHLFQGDIHVSDVNPDEFLLSAGIRSASFQAIGDAVVGFIIRQPDVQQQRDFNTGQPKFWSDGNPMMQLRVVLMTEQRDPEDPEDSGERAVYIRGNMQKAVAQAVRQAGAKGLEAGGKLLIKYSGDGEATQRGFNPPKLYQARYRPPVTEATPVPEPANGRRPAQTGGVFGTSVEHEPANAGPDRELPF